MSAVAVFVCVFFWGASAGMIFPFPTSFFVRSLFVPFFIPQKDTSLRM